MTSKLYIKRGGALSLETEVTDMTGRQGAPFFDGQQPLINLGMRYADGESAQGNFLLNDPDAIIHDTTYRLVPHGLVTWTEDASGDELWLARNRIAPLESGRRGTYIADRDIEWNVQTVDCNIDLTGNHFTEAWERPAETDIDRIIALHGYILNGASSLAPKHRISTDIRCNTIANGHLLNGSDEYNLPARTYPAGTVARDVLQDIAERAGKLYGVVIHHTGGESHLCLLYIQENDHDTYRTDIKISQRVADWLPNHPTAPVVEPKWDRGKGTRTDNDGVISGLVSIYGGTSDDPNVIFVDQPADEDPYEFWTDSFFDSESENATEAENRANSILAARRAPGHRTHQLSIKLHPEQTALICAGMSIEVKSVVVSPNDPMAYVERRITELRWEPSPDGDYWAHIDLDLPLRRARVRGGAGQPAATSPKSPPVCEPADPTDLPSEAINANWTTGNPLRVDPFVGGAPSYPWGSVGQLSDYAGAGNHTHVGGSQLSQYFTVTGGGQVTVSTSLAKIGGPGTATFTIQFRTSGGAIISNESRSYWSGQHCSGFYCNPNVIWSPQSFTFDVPATAAYALVRVGPNSAVQYLLAGEPADVEDCPPHSVDPNGFPNDGDGEESDNDSPYFLRSDSPLLTATDQHIITRLSRDMTNASGGDLLKGAVVIAINQDEFTTTTTASYAAGMVGVLKADVADGEVGTVVWAGVGTVEIPLFTGGTPTEGDFIFTSTTAGKATSSATRAAGAIGKVLNVESGEVTFVEWWGVPDSSSGGGSAHTIKENGTPLTARAGLNFGSGIVATDDSGNNETDVDLDWAEDADVSTQAFGDSPTTGTNQEVARGGHKHGMPANPVTAHEAASDPHTGYVLESLIDAKGDLIVGSAADTVSRVAVGSDNKVLTADSTAGSGVVWKLVSDIPGATNIGWIDSNSNPDKPPASPNAVDDEFDAGSLDAKWTQSGGAGAATFADSKCILFAPSASSSFLTQAFTPGASTAFTIRIKFAGMVLEAPTDLMGVQLQDSSAVNICGVDIRNGSGIQFHKDVAAVGTNRSISNVGEHVYLEIARDASDVWTYRMSHDGIVWSSFGMGTNTTSTTVSKLAIRVGTTRGVTYIGAGIDWIRRVV